MNRAHRPLALTFWFAAGMVIAALLLLFGMRSTPVAAQDLGLEISKTLAGSSTVQVGQILEFTIRITNTGTLSITELQVVDDFEADIVAPSGMGEFARADDPPLSDTEPYVFDGASTIRWDLFGGLDELGPGESVAIVVRLRAVRPTSDLTVVNRARIEAAVRSDGQSSGGGEAEVPARPEGATLPFTKSLGVPGPVQAGLPITFTLTVINDGLIDIPELPMRDIYNPAALAYLRADPPPTAVDEAAGVVRWQNLVASAGLEALGPGETITVEIVFRALRDIRETTNRAEVSGAKDEYGNAIEAQQAEVPIQIVDDGQPTAVATSSPQPTTTALATRTPEDEEEEEGRRTAGPTATATAVPTFVGIGSSVTPTAEASATIAASATVAASATATTMPAGGIPVSLPNTGASTAGLPLWLPFLALLLLSGAVLIRRR
jgi:LPXTG-motif cell wall-anchored protein